MSEWQLWPLAVAEKVEKMMRFFLYVLNYHFSPQGEREREEMLLLGNFDRKICHSFCLMILFFFFFFKSIDVFLFVVLFFNELQRIRREKEEKVAKRAQLEKRNSFKSKFAQWEQ